MFLVDQKSEIPVFKQIEKQVIEFISIGVLDKNEQLPSVRSVASDLGINPNTVAKAYKELEEAGYVYSQKGKGCFVSNDDSSNQIKSELLNDLKIEIENLKKHQIEKEDIIELIERIYAL